MGESYLVFTGRVLAIRRSVDHAIRMCPAAIRERETRLVNLRIEVENVPSENPRTGRLSYLSAIAMLRELGAAVQVGN